MFLLRRFRGFVFVNARFVLKAVSALHYFCFFVHVVLVSCRVLGVSYLTAHGLADSMVS